MIGLVVNPNDLDVAEEFFELFKTPWEPAVPGRKYSAVLCTDGPFAEYDADVILVYSSGEQGVDREAGVLVHPANGPVDIAWREWTFPIYRGVGICEQAGHEGTLKAGSKSIDCRYPAGDRIVRRIGYDLFQEVRYLLTEGQPVVWAGTPTLDLHIELLRQLLIESNVSFLEIPPRPAGYDFICCLTHDVDFFGIRRHGLDRTMAGFLYRASIGSLIDLVRGRRSPVEVIQNWLALLSLPFVFLRLMPDFWRPFDDYAKAEAGLRSTFFLVPFKDRPGFAPDGVTKAWRAVPYGIGEIQPDIMKAAANGSEFGVHGIDAWRDPAAGAEELRQLRTVTGQETVGVRMHWLYFDTDSHTTLEKAGFDYDSTWGYNEAVGYRAGTSQVFRPTSCENLMELPMTIMDSALFSAGRMNLDRREALQLCTGIVKNARQFGGTLVINWHERSLAPERLWGRAYMEFFEMIRKGERVWFATAGDAVEWFRWRRSIRFSETKSSDATTVIHVSAPCSESLGAILCIQRPSPSGVKMQELTFDGLSTVELELCPGSCRHEQPVVEP